MRGKIEGTGEKRERISYQVMTTAENGSSLWKIEKGNGKKGASAAGYGRRR